jgi:hypothetical protein
MKVVREERKDEKEAGTKSGWTTKEEGNGKKKAIA